MSNYSTLKQAIQSVIKTNGNEEITGTVLQNVLLSIVDSIGANYTFAGVATPQTDAGAPDQNVFYIAPAGTYTNFGSSSTVDDGCIAVFMYDGSWTCTSVPLSDSGTFYAEIQATSTASWHNLPKQIAGKKVLIRADVETDNISQLVIYGEDTSLGTIFRNLWQFVDLSAYTSAKLYVQSSASVTVRLQVITSQTLIAEMERERKIIEVQSGATASMDAGTYYSNTGDVVNVHLRVSPALDNQAYPIKGVYYKGFTLSANDLFWLGEFLTQFYNGKLTRFVNEDWLSNMLQGLTIQPSNYGFLQNQGIAVVQTTNQGNSYTDYIPVTKGTRLHVHGGYFAGTYNYTLFGYKTAYDGVAGNNTPLSPITDNSVQDYIVEITDPNIRYVRMWSTTSSSFVGDAGAPFIRVLPSKNTAYDVVVDANGEGDFANLYQAIKATSYMADHASIYVKAGSYEMPKVAHNSTFAGNRKLSIIGESKESVTIYNNDGYYNPNGSGADKADSSPLRLSGQVTIKNVTIRSLSTEYSGSGTPASYCVHVDFPASDGSIMEIENCRMYNDHYACIGIGLQAGFTLKIRNCELYSNSLAAYEHNAWNGAIICHDGMNAGNPQRIEMCNNLIECTGDHAVSLMPAFNNQIDALFIGNAIFAADVPVYKSSPVVIDSITCLNNITIS